MDCCKWRHCQLACWVWPVTIRRGIDSIPGACALLNGSNNTAVGCLCSSTGKVFAPGHDLGIGLLIGGIGAMLAVKSILPMVSGGEDALSTSGRSACVAGSLGSACVALCLETALRHDTYYIAILAVAVGWIGVTAILLAGIALSDSVKPNYWPVMLIVPAGYCTTLCTALALASIRMGAIHPVAAASISLQVLVLLIASAAPISLLIAALFRGLAAGKAIDRLASPIYFVAGVVAFIASVRTIDRYSLGLTRDSARESQGLEHLFVTLSGGSHLLQAVAVGVLGISLCAWLSSSSDMGSRTKPSDGGRNAFSLIAILASSLLAYQLLTGLGVALAALAGFLPVALLLISRNHNGSKAKLSPETLAALACAATGMALYRLFFSLYDGSFPLSPYTDQYAVFGLAAGIALPVGLSQMGYSYRSSSPTWRVAFGLVCAGIGSIVVPAALMALWGNRCSIAFITSAAISSALLSALNSARSEQESGVMRAGCILFGSLAIPVFMCEWGHYALANTLDTRVSKEHFALAIGAVIAVIIVLQAIVQSVSGARTSAEEGEVSE